MFDNKGQAEDIFSDMLPALIIIIIAVIVAGFMSSAHTRSVEASLSSSRHIVMKNEVLSFLNLPIRISMENMSSIPANHSSTRYDKYRSITAGAFLGMAGSGKFKDEKCSDYFRNIMKTFFEHPVSVSVYKDDALVFSCRTEDVKLIDLPDMTEPQEMIEESFKISIPSYDGRTAVVEVGYGS